ncbi:MAG: hypothetical protein C0392_06935 [Syntrophus sp. (in: bacteria)]|nr:hypothetical protein [Syntrophus sp. (in: bacteria)]
MHSVAEFIETRKCIETLTRQIILSAENNAVQKSKQDLDEANRQLEILRTMVANDVQVIVVDRLTRQLTSLGTKVETKVAKKKPVKKKSKTEAEG